MQGPNRLLYVAFAREETKKRGHVLRVEHSSNASAVSFFMRIEIWGRTKKTMEKIGSKFPFLSLSPPPRWSQQLQPSNPANVARDFARERMRDYLGAPREEATEHEDNRLRANREIGTPCKKENERTSFSAIAPVVPFARSFSSSSSTST